MSNNEAQPILTQDKNLLTFYEEVLPNGLAGAKAGRVVFDKALMVRVSVPGDKSEVTYEVDRSYPEEFPHPIHGKMKKNELVYAKFGKYIDDYKARMEGGADMAGTPIDKWAMVDMRMAANLKFHGVYTVEALAAVHDGNAAAMGMGIRELIQKAKDWLLSASNSAAAMEAQAKARQTEARFAELEEKFNDLAAAFESLDDGSKAKVKEALGKKSRKQAA